MLRKLLPAREDEIAVAGIELHDIGGGAGALGGDDRGPRAGEQVEADLAWLQVIPHGTLPQLQRFRRRVLVVGLPSHLPDRRLISLSQELVALPPPVEAGLVSPMVVRAAELEAFLDPHDLLVDGDADCRESGQERGPRD